ncbi:MAG: hypothetical protein Kow00124_12670 [Anaerolineae bacterium]
MGIRLDWEIESEGGWEQVGEDPAEVRQRQRRLRRLRGLILALLLIATLVIAGGFWLRGQIQAQRLADLQAAVSAEVDALRSGDRAAFLSGQLDRREWLAWQEGVFDDYRVMGGRLELAGEVLEAQVEGDAAAVTLREWVDGEPYRVTWFYEYDQGRWWHGPPRPAFWGEAGEIAAGSVLVEYYARDSAFAENLATLLSDWWALPCLRLGCPDVPPLLRVRVVADPLANFGWAGYDDQTLLIPSPLLGRAREDGMPDPTLRRQLAGVVAARWADLVTGEMAPGARSTELEWFEAELYRWLFHELDPSAPPAPMLGPLGDTYGGHLIPMLLEDLQAGRQAVAALERLTGVPADDLALDWREYLTWRLRAEITLLLEGHPTEARLLFSDPQRSEPDGRLAGGGGCSLADPDSLEGMSTHQMGALTWLEVRCRLRGSGTEVVGFEPYRLADERWVHTSPRLEDWGEGRQTQAGSFTVRFYAADAAFVAELFPFLQEVYAQAAADLAPTAGPLSLELHITPCHDPSCREDILLPDTEWAGINSPLLTSYPAESSMMDDARRRAAREIVDAVLRQQMPARLAASPLVAGLAIREMEALGFEVADLIEPTPDQADTLDELWLSGQRGSLGQTDHRGAYLLIGLVVERYGERAVPALARYLPDSFSMDDWLSRSVGASAAELEAEWQARLAATSDR